MSWNVVPVLVRVWPVWQTCIVDHQRVFQVSLLRGGLRHQEIEVGLPHSSHLTPLPGIGAVRGKNNNTLKRTEMGNDWLMIGIPIMSFTQCSWLGGPQECSFFIFISTQRCHEQEVTGLSYSLFFPCRQEKLVRPCMLYNPVPQLGAKPNGEM